MAIYRSLRGLISKNPPKSRPFFTAITSPLIPTSPYTPLFSPYLPHHLSHPHSARFLSPLTKWIIPFQGPLFLFSPPWKLSQSATPLYLRGNAVVLKKVEALNLNLNLDLIRNRTGLPVKLAFGSVSSQPRAVLDQIVPKEEVAVKDGIVESFVNFPNFISMCRLVSGPFLGWMIINDMYSLAFVGLAISGASDWLDGYMARKMRINSVVGSYLDPLADKVLIGCVSLAMVHKDLLHSGLVGLVVSRDVALIGGAFYQRAVKPLFLSKVNTVFQLVLVAAALLQPEFASEDTQSCITYLSWLVASTTVASTAAYGAQHMRRTSALMMRKS